MGDRNTKFFHMSTAIRKRRNKIEGIKDIEGNWISQKGDLKNNAVNCIMDLFKNNEGGYIPQGSLNLFLEDLAKNIDTVVSHDDVRQAAFSIGALRAPGEDGILALFHQQAWKTCRKNFTNFVKVCFGNSFPRKINSTLIALVPKIDNPKSMAEMRLIGLCNTVYKVLTKIIVSKLKPILLAIISPTQVSFVPGRHITYNIFVLQELIQRFRSNKGETGFIAWKIELSKAYDQLSWKFLMDIVKEIGLFQGLGNLIEHCISTVSYRAIINGEITDSFSPKCGIRQDDPLSPYLFVLAMEKFSQIIKVAVDAGHWKEAQVNRGGASFSLIFFC